MCIRACACAYAFVRVCVCVRERECVCARAYVCVCVYICACICVVRVCGGVGAQVVRGERGAIDAIYIGLYTSVCIYTYLYTYKLWGGFD